MKEMGGLLEVPLILCRNQRIVIKSTGSLTLDNVLLTVNSPLPPSISCPNLVSQHLWRGIYIEGKSVIIAEEENPVILGSLYLQNGSVLERAIKAIHAPLRFGSIQIENSTLRECGQLLDARDVWPFSFPEEENGIYDFHGLSDEEFNYCGWALENPPSIIKLTDSYLSCDVIPVLNLQPTSQIRVSGTVLRISNTDITNNTSASLTAINHSKGRLSLLNGSTVDGFNIGISKGIDIFTPCADRGLVVSNSGIVNTVIGIENIGSLISVKGSYIDGRINCNGIAYQTIIGNNISGSGSYVYSNMPQLPSYYSENYFDESYVLINGSNDSTNLKCNTWNSNYAVEIIDGQVGSPTILPPSWGSVFRSSGNKKVSSYSFMSNYEHPDSNLLHYVILQSVPEEFNYVGSIEPKSAFQPDSNCNYVNYPDTIPIQNPTWIHDILDLDSMNLIYLLFDSLIAIQETAYSNTTDSTARQYFESIFQSKIEKGFLTGMVLRNINQVDTLDALMWLARANPKFSMLSRIYAFFYKCEYDSILNALEPVKDEDDALALYGAISWLRQHELPGIGIFNLDGSIIDTLILFAESSFGDYTNILRSFLNGEYDINIPWPDPVLTRSISQQEDESEDIKSSFKVKVVPNPSSGCFQLILDPKMTSKSIVRVYNLQGKLVLQEPMNSSLRFCLNEPISGLYLVAVLTNNNVYTQPLMIFRT